MCSGLTQWGWNDVFWRTVALEATDFACSSLTVAWVKAGTERWWPATGNTFQKISVATGSWGNYRFLLLGVKASTGARLCWGEPFHFKNRLWPVAYYLWGIRQENTISSEWQIIECWGGEIVNDDFTQWSHFPARNPSLGKTMTGFQITQLTSPSDPLIFPHYCSTIVLKKKNISKKNTLWRYGQWENWRNMDNVNNSHLLKVDYLPDTRVNTCIYPTTNRLRQAET